MNDQFTTRITIGDAARILGVSKDTIRRMISAGELTAYRIGSGSRAPIRLDVDDVEQLARPIATVRAGQ